MKGSIIEEVDSYRYLGTILDNKVNGDPQYSKLIQTLSICHTKRFITDKYKSGDGARQKKSADIVTDFLSSCR